MGPVGYPMGRVGYVMGQVGIGRVSGGPSWFEPSLKWAEVIGNLHYPLYFRVIVLIFSDNHHYLLEKSYSLCNT